MNQTPIRKADLGLPGNPGQFAEGKHLDQGGQTLPNQQVLLARQIAVQAHDGQVDKAGLPYIDHPRRVAETLAQAGADPRLVAAGWLHDVVEDCPGWSLERLGGCGVSPEVVELVDLLTKRRFETRETYLHRVSTSADATRVKQADTQDNTDPLRLALLPERIRNKLIAKYSKVS